MEKKQPSNPPVIHRRNPHFEGLLAVVDFVLAYLFFVSALDNGSLLQYAIGFLALGLGIRSTVTVVKSIIKHRKVTSE